MIAATDIRSPFVYTPHVRRPAASPAAEPSGPVDVASVAPAAHLPVPQEARLSTSARWLAAGALALAALAPALASSPSLAPVMPEVMSQVVEEPRQQSEEQRPIPASQQQQLRRNATPSIYDNWTARNVRNRYSRLAERAIDQANAFQQNSTRLRDLGQQLDTYTRLGSGTHTGVVDGTVTVELHDGVSRVVLETANGTQESMHGAGRWSVVVREDGNYEFYEETNNHRTVSTGGVTSRLYTARTNGYRPGDFEVREEQGPRRTSRVLVRDGTIRAESRETIHGFAGDIRLQVRESYEVPEISILPSPRTVMRHTRETTRLDTVSGHESLEMREVQVRDDGSTHTRVKKDGHTQDFLEPGAILIA